MMTMCRFLLLFLGMLLFFDTSSSDETLSPEKTFIGDTSTKYLTESLGNNGQLIKQISVRRSDGKEIKVPRGSAIELLGDANGKWSQKVKVTLVDSSTSPHASYSKVTPNPPAMFKAIKDLNVLLGGGDICNNADSAKGEIFLPSYDETWDEKAAFEYLRDTQFDCQDLDLVAVDFKGKKGPPKENDGWTRNVSSDKLTWLREAQPGWTPRKQWNWNDMRTLAKVEGLVIHHTAGDWSNRKCNPHRIEEMHHNRQYAGPGYHFYICFDPDLQNPEVGRWKVYELRPTTQQGAHAGKPRSDYELTITDTKTKATNKVEIKKGTNLNENQIGVVIEGNYHVQDLTRDSGKNVKNPHGYPPDHKARYETLSPPGALAKLGQLTQCLVETCEGSLCEIKNHGKPDTVSEKLNCGKVNPAHSINCGHSECPGENLVFLATALRIHFALDCSKYTCCARH